ncbi:MAG TPA: ORF6N domain-containing protein [Bacteroidia bacterium]|jgi:hypothetical protein|nr:ORF6N domain-containing protein [Bacteroidia bacterium]
MKKNNLISRPDEKILNHIYFVRGEKVILDRDLASLYGVETKYLKRQVNRSRARFPKDFMFELTKAEFENWRCQFGTSNSSDKMGLRYTPYAFTEQGVAMLSSVLNSEKAISVNIQIIRIFTKFRKMYADHTGLKLAVKELRKKTNAHSEKIDYVFKLLDELFKQKSSQENRKLIGYKSPKSKD